MFLARISNHQTLVLSTERPEQPIHHPQVYIIGRLKNRQSFSLSAAAAERALNYAPAALY
jgi:hypothetical protein